MIRNAKEFSIANIYDPGQTQKLSVLIQPVTCGSKQCLYLPYKHGQHVYNTRDNNKIIEHLPDS